MKLKLAALVGFLVVAAGVGAWWLGLRDEQPKAFSQERLRQRSDQLLQISALNDPAAKAAALRRYVDDNPRGPYLDMAYGLLLPAVAAADPKAALELADTMLERYPEPDHAAIRYRAHQFKLAASARDPMAAALLARRILERESDPDLLRMASRFDPTNAEAFDRKIAAGEADRKRAELARRSAELVELEPGRWESMDAPERIAHLDQLIGKLEKAVRDPREFDRLPSLRRLRITLLLQTGDPKRALALLDRQPAGQDDAWRHSAKAVALESLGDAEAALGEHLKAFVAEPNRESWSRIRALSEPKGLSEDDSAAQVRAAMAASASVFQAFEYKTPEGRTVGLEDLRNDAILINFFFPG